MRSHVDDAAKFARDHAVDCRLDQRDRGQHVAVECPDPVVALEFAEIARRRSAGIVDEEVGVGAGGENGVASFVVTAATTAFGRLPVAEVISSAALSSTSRRRAAITSSTPSRANA